jgi:hypothetical protein
MLQPKKKTRGQAWRPVVGFVLILSCAAMAYFLGPAIVTWLDQGNVIRGFPPRGVPIENIRWILRGIVFVILILLGSLLVAVAAPKRKSAVNEKQMTKQREQLVLEKKARKIRQQQMNKMNKGR